MTALQLESSRTLGQTQQVVQLKSQMLWKSRVIKHENRKPIIQPPGFWRMEKKNFHSVEFKNIFFRISQHYVGKRFFSSKETKVKIYVGYGHATLYCWLFLYHRCGPPGPGLGHISASRQAKVGNNLMNQPMSIMGSCQVYKNKYSQSDNRQRNLTLIIADIIT